MLKIYEFISVHGKEIMHVLQYHCHLNLIWLVRSKAKRRCVQHC